MGSTEQRIGKNLYVIQFIVGMVLLRDSRCQTEFLRSILSINSGHIIASHPRSQVLFCPASISLQTLWPFFKSWMARLVNSLQRCNGAYLSGRFWKLNSKTEFSLGDKFKPIPATSINIIQVWQFRLPLKLPRGPCPPPLHVTEGVKEPRKKMKLLMKL